MTRYIDSDRLMDFIRSEAAERASAFQPADAPTTRAEDAGFIEGLEVVALYVERTAQDVAA